MRVYLTLIAALGIFAGATRDLPAQRPLRDIPKGSNLLFGRVLDAGTDAAVSGAVVNLVGFFDASGRALTAVPQSLSAPDASTPRSVMTNGDGYFVFRDLPAGKYAIASQAFGYIVESYPLQIVEVADGDKPTSASLRLSKCASVSGRVFDEQGDPLAGIAVFALRRVLIGGRTVLRETTAEALTDDRGIYRLANLAPGSYVVGVLWTPETIPASLAREIDATATEPGALTFAFGGRFTTGEGLRVGDAVLQRPGPAPILSPAGKVLSYATTFFPGTQAPAEATVVTLGSGEERPAVDLPLRLQPMVRVSGAVTGPDGPMKRLEVRLVLPNSAYPTDGEPVGASTAITDSNGAFTFLAVPPGHYELQAWSYASFGTFEPNTTPPPAWAVQDVTVGEADIAGLAVAMKPGIRVRGRVELKSSQGSATRDLQSSVHLQPLGAEQWRPSLGRSAADGTFETGGDPPGRYQINASPTPQNAAPNARWTLLGITRGGKPIADSILDLDAEVSDVVITFSDRANRVSGSVVDANGAPGVHSDVIVFPADTELWREGIFPNSWRVRKVHATSNATFDVSNLQPGQYYMAAVSSRLTGEWQDPRFLERLVAAATRITVGDGEERTVALKTITPGDR